MLKLILPEEKYWQSFQDGLQEFKTNPTPYDTCDVAHAFDFTNFAAYKESYENARKGIGLKSGYVPMTVLWLIDDEKFIGIYTIRHYLTEALQRGGGHIGYSVIPSARGKGIAAQGLMLCCQYAHDVLDIQDALLCCHAANIASYKTMKKVMIEFGGTEATPAIIDNHEEKRVWIRTKPRPQQIRPLAVAVIKKGNKVLALKGFDEKKKETFYRLIGGGIEFGETGKDAVKREFMEELGFVPQNIEYLTTVENIFTFNGHPGHEIVLAYKAELPEELKAQNKFQGVEKNIEDKYAEFIEICSDNKIYPEGIV